MFYRRRGMCLALVVYNIETKLHLAYHLVIDFSTIIALGTNSLNSADVPLINKQPNEQTNKSTNCMHALEFYQFVSCCMLGLILPACCSSAYYSSVQIQSPYLTQLEIFN